MAFDIERIQKSTRRIAKFLRKNSKRPGSTAVHNLRTSTRSLVTTFATLGLDSKRKVRRLLRDLRNVQKRAGKVRDMDVLTADALTVEQDGEQDCHVQLLEYLGVERNKYARRLRQAIKAAGGRLRRNLKRRSKCLEKSLERSGNDGPVDADAVPTTMARTIKLSTELNLPRRLNRKNLHPYRLKVKELPTFCNCPNRRATMNSWKNWERLKTRSASGTIGRNSSASRSNCWITVRHASSSRIYTRTATPNTNALCSSPAVFEANIWSPETPDAGRALVRLRHFRRLFSGQLLRLPNSLIRA